MSVFIYRLELSRVQGKDLHLYLILMVWLGWFMVGLCVMAPSRFSQNSNWKMQRSITTYKRETKQKKKRTGKRKHFCVSKAKSKEIISVLSERPKYNILLNV